MRRLISACLLSLSLLAASSVALAQVGSEQQLKAAFIVNFLKYVEWPEANRVASICLFGRDTLGANLASFEGRTVGGYELVVRRVLSPDQMAGCQIVFVPEVEDARYGAVLRWLDGQPVLTVSDGENFARLGGGISLVRGESRLQFDVNLVNTARAGLRPSSAMLRLARQVIGGSK